MTGKKIYLIRHGQTEYNLKRIVQGSGVDSSLNDTGRAQARAFHRMYGGLKFDRIYTSVLKRTTETVQPFLDAGYEHEQLEGLNEINWGNKEGLVVDEQEHNHYFRIIESWRSGDLGEKMEAGESPQEVAARLKPTMDYILSKEDEERILVCMHGRAMRILLCILLNYPIRCMDYFPHQNTCLYKLVFTGSMIRIDRFNDLSHLEVLNQVDE